MATPRTQRDAGLPPGPVEYVAPASESLERILAAVGYIVGAAFLTFIMLG